MHASSGNLKTKKYTFEGKSVSSDIVELTRKIHQLALLLYPYLILY